MDAPLTDPHPPAIAPRNTSKQAIWSLTLGILSIGCLWVIGSIPAIILGILAIRKIDRSEEALEGRGLAVAGLWTGGAGIILGFFQFAFFGAILMASLSPMMVESAKGRLSASVSESVEELVMTCQDYTADHEGRFPPSLETLWEKGYLEDEMLLKHVLPRDGRGAFYRYRPGLTTSAPALAPIIVSRELMNDTRIVGTVDGTVTVLQWDEFDSIELEGFDGAPDPEWDPEPDSDSDSGL